MPAPPLANTFEGGSDATTITTGNSGGASGDAFSTVTIGAGSTETFSADFAAHGGLSMKIVTPGTSPAATRVDWTGLGSITTDIFFRTYLYRTGNPPSGQHVFGGVRDNAAASSAQIRISTAGKIRVEDSATAFILALDGAIAMTVNQWVRIEWKVNTGTGDFQWWLYNTPDAPLGSHSETKSATAQALSTNVDQIRIGMVTSPIASDTSYYDDIAVSTAGQLGPSQPQLAPAVEPDITQHPKFLIAGRKPVNA